MEDDLYGITNDQLHAFADIQMGLKYDNDAQVADGLRELTEFGRDLREVQQSVGKLINGNPVIKDAYRDIYTEQDELNRVAHGASNKQWARLLNLPENMIKIGRLDADKRARLERELEIETAHMPRFGSKINIYLLQKVLAEDTHPEAAPHWKTEFKRDEECERYIVQSPTCQGLQRVLFDELPIRRIAYKRMQNPEQE